MQNPGDNAEAQVVHPGIRLYYTLVAQFMIAILIPEKDLPFPQFLKSLSKQ